MKCNICGLELSLMVNTYGLCPQCTTSYEKKLEEERPYREKETKALELYIELYNKNRKTIEDYNKIIFNKMNNLLPKYCEFDSSWDYNGKDRNGILFRFDEGVSFDSKGLEDLIKKIKKLNIKKIRLEYEKLGKKLKDSPIFKFEFPSYEEWKINKNQKNFK